MGINSRSNNADNEQVQRLRKEMERLQREIDKISNERGQMNIRTNVSRQSWTRSQIASNLIDNTLDKIQQHYERKLGIDND